MMEKLNPFQNKVTLSSNIVDPSQSKHTDKHIYTHSTSNQQKIHDLPVQNIVAEAVVEHSQSSCLVDGLQFLDHLWLFPSGLFEKIRTL